MIIAIVGGQYGSEGKGVVSADLAEHSDIYVRTGGPNAGHTFIHQKQKCVMQQLPCGWKNKRTQLILGAGAVISPEIFFKEIEFIKKFDPLIEKRILVDRRATVITKEDDEGHINGELHKKIGSTGEGVGKARIKKINRDIDVITTVGQMQEFDPFSLNIDTVPYLNYHNNAFINSTIILEGTQGYGLSLNLGEWPYVTSANCTSTQLLSDCGLPYYDEVIMVVRCYPIRVAGNSGELKDEINWDILSRQLGRKIIEKTTVTKKVRRIGKFDVDMVNQAVQANGATGIILTFGDYLHKSNSMVTQWNKLHKRTKEFVHNLTESVSTPVLAIGTGFDTEHGWVYVDTGWNNFKRQIAEYHKKGKS